MLLLPRHYAAIATRLPSIRRLRRRCYGAFTDAATVAATTPMADTLMPPPDAYAYFAMITPHAAFGIAATLLSAMPPGAVTPRRFDTYGAQRAFCWMLLRDDAARACSSMRYAFCAAFIRA